MNSFKVIIGVSLNAFITFVLDPGCISGKAIVQQSWLSYHLFVGDMVLADRLSYSLLLQMMLDVYTSNLFQ